MRLHLSGAAKILVKGLCVLAACLLSLFAGADKSFADQTVTPDSFLNTLKAISKQAKVTFVIEGSPVQDKTVTTQFVEAEQQGSDTEMQVAALARRFGYDTERQANIFLLRKRYDDSSDLPFLTLEECLEAAKETERRLEPFTTRLATRPGRSSLLPKDVLLSNFYQSLSSDQLDAMKANGLSVSSLSEEQRYAAWKICVHNYVEPRQEQVQDLVRALMNSLSTKAILKWSGHQNPRTLEIGGENTQLWEPSVVPLLGDMVVKTIPEPGAGTYSPSGASMSSSSEATETIAALLRRRSRDRSQPVSVDPALAEKPLIAIGEENATFDAELRAIVRVYGLRLFTGKDGSIRVLRPQAPVAAKIEELPGALKMVLPDPLVRAYHYDLLTSEANRNVSDARARQAREDQQMRDVQRFVKIPFEMATTALSDLKQDVVERLDRSPTKELPIASLSAKDRSLIALLILCQMDCLRGNLKTAPPYIKDFNNVFLTGGEENNSRGKTFTVNIATEEPGTAPSQPVRREWGGDLSTSLRPVIASNQDPAPR